MAVQVRGQMLGREKVAVNLADLQKALRNKILKKSVGEGTKVMVKAIRAESPVASKQLKKSVGRKTKTYRYSGVVVGIVGPRTGFRSMVQRYGRTVLADPTKYAHLADRGTRRSKAYRFMENARASAGEEARAAAVQALTDGIAEA